MNKKLTMNKKIINLVLGGIIILNFTNCKNESIPKKSTVTQNETNSKIEVKSKTVSETKSFSQVTFNHSKGDKEVNMIIECDYKGNLIIGKAYNVNFKTENIKPQNFKVFGDGAKVKKVSENELSYIITPLENKNLNGLIGIQVTEQIENGKNFSHKFLVPAK